MNYQFCINPKLLHQNNFDFRVNPEPNELSLNLDGFNNQHISSDMWTNDDDFEWAAQPQDCSDMDLSGDLQMTAAQPDLSQGTSSDLSSNCDPFDGLNQFFFPSPGSQYSYSSSDNSSTDLPLLEGVLPTASGTISDQSLDEHSPHHRLSPPTGLVYKCSFCAKWFDKRHLLNRHEKHHTRPVQCPVTGCPSSKATKRDMQRHIRVHHSNPTAVPRFMCPVVGCVRARDGFSRNDNLTRHIKAKH